MLNALLSSISIIYKGIAYVEAKKYMHKKNIDN
jgi:hypothetical protein